MQLELSELAQTYIGKLEKRGAELLKENQQLQQEIDFLRSLLSTTDAISFYGDVVVIPKSEYQKILEQIGSENNMELQTDMRATIITI